LLSIKVKKPLQTQKNICRNYRFSKQELKEEKV